MTELKSALSKAKKNRAAGPDGIYNEMLWQVSDGALKKLLKIFNQIFSTGEIPDVMKAGLIIPLPKPGKDLSLLPSFRPITLTSTIAKLMERMVCSRMMYILESKEALAGTQSGFRSNRNTIDQINRLVSDVSDGFQCSRPHKRTVAALVDFSRAFDRVDHLMLLEELCNLDIPPQIVRWFKGFLEDRKNKVRVKDETSIAKRFTSGVPQGTVTGPSLFIVYINTLAKQLSTINELKFSMFADDLTLWATSSDPSTAANIVQKGLDVVQIWAKKYKMLTAAEKCEAIIFSNWHKDQDPNRRPSLKMEGNELKYSESVKLLGIVLDSRIKFGKQINKIQKEANERMCQMRALACSTWGCSPSTLRTLYMGYIRSVLEYGADVWSSMVSQTNIKKLEVIQNKAARLITGCVSSTDIPSLLMEADLVPLVSRYEFVTAKRREKMIRMPTNDPLRQIVDAEKRPDRLKTKSWTEASKQIPLPVGIEETDFTNREQLNLIPRFPPWRCQLERKIKLRPNLIQEVNRNTCSAEMKRDVTSRTIRSLGHHDLELWTDGSVRDFKSSGAAILFDNTSNNTEEPVLKTICPAGKLAASYHAEISALTAGLEMIIDSPFLMKKSLLVCTDSQSSIRKLQQGPIQTEGGRISKLWEKLFRVASQMHITIQFVPSHCGIVRNEHVDELAKSALDTCDQRAAKVSLDCAVTAVKGSINTRWKTGIPTTSYRAGIFGSKTAKPEADLTRKEVSLLSQLRCGQCRWIGEWRVKAGLTVDGTCRWCGMAEETVSHIFDGSCYSRVIRRLRRGRGIRGVEVLKTDGKNAVEFVMEALENVS